MADQWGTKARVNRPALGNPSMIPEPSPSERRMAEIAYDKGRAKTRAVEVYDVNRATGQGPKPRARANSDGSFTIRGVDAGTFFSPMQPMPPAAQDPEQGAVGRRFDYLVGYNLQYRPRSVELIGFQTLRDLADNLDILRLVIETRKDQMEALDWKIQPIDRKAKGVKFDDVTKFLRYPDGEHAYSEWQRAILEDLFVIDAPTIYPRYSNDGKTLMSLDLMDGAMIVPRIDATGRRPAPPDVAFQQVLKGLPAVDYSSDELIYRPRNVRTHKIYGYSQVEQILVTIDIALRRQLFQRSYYTEGSVPDAFGFVPETWTPSMIAEYQAHWDLLFENLTGGNTAARRHMRWVPGAKDVKFAKDAILKDEFDEWLARVVCYCFSVEPTPFVKMMNRSTSETQQEQSRTEGLLPLKKWWKSLMDYIILKHLRRDDVEFSWVDEESLDPKTRADVDTAYVGAGILTKDEIREELGKEPLTDEQKADQAPPPPAAPGGPAAPAAYGGTKGPKPGTPGAKSGTKTAKPVTPATAAKKLAKAGGGKTVEVDSSRRAVMIQTQRLTRAVKRVLRGQAAKVIARLGPKVTTTVEKADDAKDKKTPDDLLEDFGWQDEFGGSEWADEVSDPLRKTAADGADTGAASVGVNLDPDFVNEFASTYARDRGAEMVGMKWVDGELVANPDAEWVISEATRDMVRDKLTAAIDEGWSNQKFADEISGDDGPFGATRAEMIARTETAYADSQGHVAAWKESGVVEKKQWLLGDEACDECVANADQGPIDIDEDFDSGDDAPPLHPNCRCTLAAVVEDSADSGDAGDAEKSLGALRRAAPFVPVPVAPDNRAAEAIEKLAAAVAGHKTEIIINVPDQAAPVVNVAGPTINVPPPRKVERVVTERDANKMISKVIERDVE